MIPTKEMTPHVPVSVYEVIEDAHRAYEVGLTIIELFNLYKKDFIVQEKVEQNEFLKSLNPSSLNTLRIVSYLREDEVHLLSVALIFGNQGSKIDNFSGGGIFWGID